MTQYEGNKAPQQGPAREQPRRARRYGVIVVTAVVTAIATAVVATAVVIFLSSSDGVSVPPDPTADARRGCYEEVRALYFTVGADPVAAQAHKLAADALFTEAGGEWANRAENQHRHRGHDSKIDIWCRTLLEPVRP
jgi:hypothetical protein